MKAQKSFAFLFVLILTVTLSTPLALRDASLSGAESAWATDVALTSRERRALGIAQPSTATSLNANGATYYVDIDHPLADDSNISTIRHAESESVSAHIQNQDSSARKVPLFAMISSERANMLEYSSRVAGTRVWILLAT